MTASALFSVSAQQKPRGTQDGLKESSPPPAEQAQAARWLRQDRSGFTENKGQFLDQTGKPNPAVKYLLHMPGLNVQLRPSGFSYDTYAQKGSSKKTGFHRVDVELVGANPNALMTTGPAISQPVNVINEHGSFINIRKFQSVTYHEVYPGIDLEFVAQPGTKKPVEYNFIVRPGGDASTINLRYQGAKTTTLQNERVVMSLNHGKLSENIPASWIKQDQKPVRVHYKALGSDVYAFNVPAYDKTQTLVIDPTPNLDWATYYGGTGNETLYSIENDDSGNVYVVGVTTSPNTIASAGAQWGTLTGASDAFIAKFNNQGQRVWSTYFGGSGGDLATAVAFSKGELYVAGTSNSDGLATPGAYQSTRIGSTTNSYFAKFNASTGARTWTTYAGDATGWLTPSHMTVDETGAFYVVGIARIISSAVDNPGGFGTPGTFRPTARNTYPSCLVKYTASGTKAWGTFLENSTTTPNVSSGVVVDAEGNVYVTGTSIGTGSTANYYKELVGGVSEGQTRQNIDGFILKLNPTSGTRIWGRYVGGPDHDRIHGIALDKARARIYVVGGTSSTTGIASANAFRTSLGNPNRDGFWASFDLNGIYQQGTYLGAQAGDTYLSGVRLDAQGNLLVSGTTTTTTGELASDCSYQPMPGGGEDLVINRFDVTSGQRIWGTYLGNAADEMVVESNTSPTRYNTLAIDPQGNPIIAFYVPAGSAGHATSGSYQFSSNGGTDAVIAKFNSQGLPDNFTTSASTLSPLTQNACILGIPGIITGSAVEVTSPSTFQGKVFYQWQKATSANGPWEDLPGEIFKDLQPLASQTTLYYRRQVKVCDQQVIATSPVASVVIGANAAPIASANGPQWFVCGTGANTVALNGSATGGTGNFTYQWFAGSTSTGSPVATTATFTTPAVTEATTYTLQVKDGAGCFDIDQVTVVPAVANAGGSKSVCQGSGGVQLGTAPVASSSVTYAWSVVSGGPLSTLSCTTCAQPIANPSVATTYRLTVSVKQKNGTVCTTTSEATVTPVAAPSNTVTFAGSDKTICKNQSVQLGGTADASFAYTWTSGQYLDNSQVANPTFTAGTAAVSNGFIDYTVNAEKNGCVFTDQVRVSVINSRITNQDETVCGPAWSSHLDEDNAPGTTYTWSIVSGDGVILQTSNNGKNAYLKSNAGVTRFRRTTTLNGVACTADVLIQPCSGNSCNFDIVTLSNQGCPKVFGSTVLRLGTTVGNSSNYNFSWSPANLVDNPTAATVTITSTQQATITVTITNKYDASISCSESIVINPPGWSLPVFTAADKYTCPNVPVQIGNSPLAGFNYAWTPDEGLSNPNIANPLATVARTQTFIVKVTEAASGCRTADTVRVNASAPVADAGRDRAVCNGATVTLGTPAPAGTNWVYSWTPANAAWTNGTNASSPQPQLQFAFSTPQTYILKVTDPVSGCTDADTVVLRNTAATGEYAGQSVTTCQGVPVTLGRQAEPLAQYAWSPATGLSCTTCANPTVTNPTATTTYTVQVSYPGCNTPLTDQITVTVNTITGLSLVDKTQCSGGVAIGYGSANNPAAPTGATYTWSPAQGLSSTTAANPTATVSQRTTYTVAVMLANGCTFTDQVVVTPTAGAGAPVTICPGQSTVIGTPAIAGATYSWTGAGIVGAANVAQPTVKPTATTTYTVNVTSNGCTSSSQVTVTVDTPADFTITGNTTICQGGATTLGLAGTPAVGTTWQWSPVAGVASPTATSTVITPSATQTYRLTQTTQPTGCSNFKEVVVVVNTNTIAATTQDLAVCAGSAKAMPLTVSSTGNYSYVWAPSTGLSDPFSANPTVTTSTDRLYTVTITDNTSKCQLVLPVNVTVNPIEACYSPVTLTGNVFHDANALKDVTVNSTSTQPIPTGLYVTLVDANGQAVKTVAVGSNGAYDFGVTPTGNYSVVLHQTAGGSTTPSLPSGWINTGENLGAGVGSDEGVNGILTGITVAGVNVTNANFGVQQPPVTSDKTLPSRVNPGGTTTVNLSNEFTFSDVDGTPQTITFTQFPANTTTVTINGTTYVAPGTTPGSGQSVWPGTVTVPVTNLSVLIDPVDGAVTSQVPFYVTDNGGATSNTSTVKVPFTTVVNLSGNVYHDANALTDTTVNSTSQLAIPTGLYATLVNASNQAVATVPVNANGSYNFGNVTAGTYSVVLHQTSTGSTTPSLPSGWINTGEHLGANAGSDGTVNGILPNITVATTNVTNANFGVQQPPVTSDKTLPSRVNPGGTTTVNLSNEFTFSDVDGTPQTITFTQFPANTTTVTINGTTYVPVGQTPGSGQQVWPGTVTVPVTNLTVLADPKDGQVTVQVPFYVTDNGGAKSNTSTVTVPFTTPQVTLSGNVFHDANALTDTTVNSTSQLAIPTGLYATLVDANGQGVKTVAVGSNGAYDFGTVTPATYSVVLHQTSTGSTTPALPSGWINTGEHLGTNAGSDGTVNGILPNITVATTSVTNANFGVQQPPMTSDKTLPSRVNPGGTTTVNLSNEFTFSDVDGTPQTITFTQFPANTTTVTINGTTYVPVGQTPGSGQQVWPGTVTVPVTNLTVLADPKDGQVTVQVPFYVTDNGGAKSNTSTVMVPFTTPVVSLSGNVFHDANALTDTTVNSTSQLAIPTGFYVTLVDANGQGVKTVAVGSNGAYDFGVTPAGTYSVVLHQTAGGSTTPSLPSGWINTGEHLGANEGSDGTVNGILPNITVATTSVTNANFGVQQPPLAEPKTYLIDVPSPNVKIKLDSSHVSTGTGTASPGQLTGQDPEDGRLSGEQKNRTVTITSLPTNGTLWYDGVKVTPGQVLTNYDPSKLELEFTGTGYTSTEFTYAYHDAAGSISPSVTYTLSWGGPLPVRLMSFEATLKGSQVELSWTTAQEKNSQHFEVQRSRSGNAQEWTTLGVVAAKGQSTSKQSYRLADSQPLSGTSLYRLKMVDQDGSFDYSRSRSVLVKAPFETKVYPNPASDKLYVRVTDPQQVKSLRLTSVTGTTVAESEGLGDDYLSVQHVPSGVYMLSIQHQDGSVYGHRVVIVK
ncbi:hypothetical protein BWI97_20785 [Siphonobacter sp. BAB-5405]|nr:hypothetical protein BWI97_20785 [Siphonobacter sp. BAB-5405]